ncbi:putative 4-hydroxybenzoyl-CoA thioesterase [Cystobacter fuscus DSM 2262]|uniref:4-hydroxybenzoyl-CoA thioesterase n=1 Tax=Cystobacter fuscus (strain ATCC 25194 / DSM 2262 / NBRC 100088 / M29) TaxID=1242864 RepID=S9Q540_CYSF2|nr:thioesterase family protein [Cystobacter fuscus]EPX56454.1 putative 4-hydroxybenzoyl-CoA thioesterase [Cystobacter fuscus DSM 2262]
MSDAETAKHYRYFLPITTRWMDNDAYGHINNVTYYSYFDTVANHYLIHEGGLDILASPVIGLVVESKCAYHAPLAYPDALRAGLRVDKLGNRSVTYGIGIFKQGEERAAAHGYFVHVFVDRHTRKAVAIPERLRTALERLLPA